jgi:hypothetical protein
MEFQSSLKIYWTRELKIQSLHRGKFVEKISSPGDLLMHPSFASRSLILNSRVMTRLPISIESAPAQLLQTSLCVEVKT